MIKIIHSLHQKTANSKREKSIKEGNEAFSGQTLQIKMFHCCYLSTVTPHVYCEILKSVKKELTVKTREKQDYIL